MQVSAVGNGLMTWMAPVWFTRLSEPALPAAQTSEEPWTTDRVDLMHVAFGAGEDDPNARIVELQRQIAAGTYLTADKIEATVNRLHRVLRSELFAG